MNKVLMSLELLLEELPTHKKSLKQLENENKEGYYKRDTEGAYISHQFVYIEVLSYMFKIFKSNIKIDINKIILEKYEYLYIIISELKHTV